MNAESGKEGGTTLSKGSEDEERTASEEVTSKGDHPGYDQEAEEEEEQDLRLPSEHEGIAFTAPDAEETRRPAGGTCNVYEIQADRLSTVEEKRKRSWSRERKNVRERERGWRHLCSVQWCRGCRRANGFV